MSRVLPILFNTDMVRAILDGRKTVTRRTLKHPFEVHPNGFITKPRGSERLCPYEPPYKPGDILYVRETWCRGSLDYKKEQYYYKADNVDFSCKWHPSIHMPKEAARIWLKVMDVRVERLQDITDTDILKEGLEIGCYFEDLWNSTIKKKDRNSYGWDANPYVWRIKFERCGDSEEV